MSKAAELAALIGSQTALSNRNMIINGAMQVAQRGTSATVGPNGTGEGYTVVDRFQNSLSGSVVSTFSQSTDAPSGFANSAKIEITTADTSLGGTEFWNLRYAFEGQDLQPIAKGTSDAKSITVSFWVKSNKTGTYTVELQDTDNSRRNSLAYTIDSSDTWEHKSLTYNPDTAGSGFANDNALSLRINFWFVAGADFKSGTFYNGTWAAVDNAKRVHSSQVNLGDTVGNEWYITGVQMEVGEQATPFEHRSYGDELNRCQRYLYLLDATSDAGDENSIIFREGTTAAALTCHLPVNLRATPSIVGSNLGRVVGYTTSFGVATASVSALGVRTNINDGQKIDINITHASLAGTYVFAHYDRAASGAGILSFDAEL